jgi:hypothetical protein
LTKSHVYVCVPTEPHREHDLVSGIRVRMYIDVHVCKKVYIRSVTRNP